MYTSNHRSHNPPCTPHHTHRTAPPAQFKQLAQQLNVPAPGLFVAAASAFALILVMALSLDGVALLAGFLYPLLGTLKAINVGEQGVMVRSVVGRDVQTCIRVASDPPPFPTI